MKIINKNLAALLAIIFLASVSTPAGKSAQTKKQSPVIAFINVNVIPMDRDRVLKNQMVVVRDGRIAEIRDAAGNQAPKEAQVIDGRGKYLIPGLIDMHTHLFSDEDFPDNLAGDELAVMVANGVTTVRLMIGTPEHLALRAKIARGELHGPSIYVASPEFTGRKPVGIFNGRSVTTPDEARRAVRECKASGYDFIKLTTQITRPVYDAVTETAKAEGIRVVGHVDLQVGLSHALAAGQQIEHLDSYMEAVLRDDSPIKVSVSDVGVWRKPNWVSLDYIDERKVSEVTKATAQAGVYSTPTLTFFKLSFAVEQSEDDLRSRPDYPFFPGKHRESRFAAHRRFWTDPPTRERRQRYISIRNRLVKGIHDAGGKIMAGSDTPELFLLYGYTLHRELQSLVEAGLTPYAALAAATRTPAEYLRADDTRGTIAPGKQADLVLLEANPLEDISNTEKRAGVMLRGRWLPESELKETLAEIAARFQRTAVTQPRHHDFAALDSVAMAELKERGTPGAAVAVIKDGQVIYAKGYGVASIETGNPVTPEMLFRLGSTTKMLTAAALVTLAERGKIKLDEPLGNRIKGLHPALARVTAHQLLSQSAGMRDFAATVVSNDDAALGQQVRAWSEDVFFTEPGRIYSYASPGYWFAGFVAEELGGNPYADVMDELLFKPLGMSRTTLRPAVAMTYPSVMGHRVVRPGTGQGQGQGQGQLKAEVIRPAFNNVAMWPGGSVYSNVSELARFVIAMMDGGRLGGTQVLSPLAVEKLPAPHVALPGAPDVHYGYGLLSYRERGVRVVSHGGASTGYGSTIQLVPEHRFAVIVLTNSSGETLPQTRDKAMELLLSLTSPEPETSPVPQSLSEAELRGYTGIYSHAPRNWEVFMKEGKLFLRHEGAEQSLTNVGQHTFSYGARRLVFVPGADGEAQHIFMGLYAARKVQGGK
jgi:CubicO group peptidase (beta-lactamase class C family)/imidazolonepropionase-like amidohydrolase